MEIEDTDRFIDYVDYFIEYLENELKNIKFLINFVPNYLIESPKVVELRINRLREEKLKLAVDAEIILLTVIDNMRNYQLEEVLMSCFLLCLQSILPNKYIEPHRNHQIDKEIQNILETFDFKTIIPWFLDQ